MAGLFTDHLCESDHHHAVRHQPAALPFRPYSPWSFRWPGQRPRFLWRKFNLSSCGALGLLRTNIHPWPQTAWNPPSGYVSGMDGDRDGNFFSVVFRDLVPYHIHSPSGAAHFTWPEFCNSFRKTVLFLTSCIFPGHFNCDYRQA